MSFQGADTEGMRTCARELRAGGTELDTLGARLSEAVTGLPWQGADAARARARWEQTDRPRLQQTAELLRAAAELLTREAEQQDAASSDGGGAVGAGALTTAGPTGPARSVDPGSQASSAGAGGIPAGATADPPRSLWERARETAARVADGPVGDALGAMGDGIDSVLVADAVAVGGQYANQLGPTATVLWEQAEAVHLPGGLSTLATGIGYLTTGLDGLSAWQAAAEGRWDGAVEKGVAAGIGVWGIAGGGLPAAGAGLAWGAGWETGDWARTGPLEKIGWNDAYQRVMAPMFERYGDWALLYAVQGTGDASRLWLLERLFGKPVNPQP